jgi:hypothetical protein
MRLSPPTSSLAPLRCPALLGGLIGGVRIVGDEGWLSRRPEVSDELKLKVGSADVDCRVDRERLWYELGARFIEADRLGLDMADCSVVGRAGKTKSGISCKVSESMLEGL